MTGPRPIDIARRVSGGAPRTITIAALDNLVLSTGKILQADLEAVEMRNPSSTVERNLMLVIQKYRMPDGSPAFAWGDLHFLKSEVDLSITQELVNFLFESTYASKDAAKEAIVNDPPSGSVSSSPNASTGA
jgi:hypothetical protein